MPLESASDDTAPWAAEPLQQMVREAETVVVEFDRADGRGDQVRGVLVSVTDEAILVDRRNDRGTEGDAWWIPRRRVAWISVSYTIRSRVTEPEPAAPDVDDSGR